MHIASLAGPQFEAALMRDHRHESCRVAGQIATYGINMNIVMERLTVLWFFFFCTLIISAASYLSMASFMMIMEIKI
jgi:hypothetical protein